MAAPRPRTQVRRLPDKAVFDKDVLYAIADEGIVAHVGISAAAQPFVMPCGYARDDDRLLLHGSTGSRLFRALGAGTPACVTITIMDGLVAAISLFESSMHYRCGIVLGSGKALRGADKRRGLDILSDHFMPGRRADARPPNRKELAATSVVAIPMDEWSVKVSAASPEVIEADEGWDPWSGIVPLQLRAATPITESGGTPPTYVSEWYP